LLCNAVTHNTRPTVTHLRSVCCAQ
jgi:hypothetical protein